MTTFHSQHVQLITHGFQRNPKSRAAIQDQTNKDLFTNIYFLVNNIKNVVLVTIGFTEKNSAFVLFRRRANTLVSAFQFVEEKSPTSGKLAHFRVLFFLLEKKSKTGILRKASLWLLKVKDLLNLVALLSVNASLSSVKSRQPVYQQVTQGRTTNIICHNRKTTIQCQ